MVTPKLPPLPEGHARALAMLSDDNVEFRDIAAVLDSDPALTTAMLRAANSAHSAPSRRIVDSHIALVRLGISESRRLVAGLALGQTFGELSRSGIDTDEMWRHVVTCALLAEVTIADWSRRSEAFTAGLLHDIGRLAMAAAAPRRYAKVVESVARGEDPLEAECRLFGADHAQWGADVGEAFSLSAGIIEAIADHHDGALSELSRSVYEARHRTWDLGVGDGLTMPEESAVDERAQEWGPVHSMGGFDVLSTRVEWYTSVIRQAS